MLSKFCLCVILTATFACSEANQKNNASVGDATTTSECEADTDCGPISGSCSAGRCVGCVDSQPNIEVFFTSCDDPSKPFCVKNELRGAACGFISECQNDDRDEENDGPAAATNIDISQLPTVKTAKACTGTTGQESDWFTFNVPENDTPIRFSLDVESPTATFDIKLRDADLNRISSITQWSNFGKFLAAGDYFVQVNVSQRSDRTEATQYTLTLDEGECRTDANCSNGLVCNTKSFACVECFTGLNCQDLATQACVSSVCKSTDNCIMDDTDEPSSDGPNGAKTLTLGTSVDAKICGSYFDNIAPNERDWYTFKKTETSNLRTTLTLPAESPGRNFEIILRDETLEPITQTSLNEAEIPSTFIWKWDALPAGTYYFEVAQLTSRMLDVAEPYNLLIEQP